MTVSYWRQATTSAPMRADVCIIGAGIAGLSSALWLSRRGLRTIVVERHTIGHGASSRNAGFLMRGAAENYAEAIDQLGRQTARHVWQLTEQNLALLRAEGAEGLSSYQRVPSCLIAFDEKEATQLRKAATHLREDGFDTTWVESGTDTLWRRAAPLGGLINPHDGACNPVELLAMLRAKLDIPVLENQEVVALEPDGAGIRVVGTSVQVVAPRVLVCTNAFAPGLLPELTDHITPRRGQMLAAHAPDVRLDAAYYVNRGSEYIRQAADATIVVGGCRTLFADAEVGLEDRTTRDVQGAIEAFARRIIGDDLTVLARWSGPMGFSPDGLPLIGQVRPSIWFCGGFTGHGMSMAFITARDAVAAMLDGAPTPFDIDRVTR